MLAAGIRGSEGQATHRQATRAVHRCTRVAMLAISWMVACCHGHPLRRGDGMGRGLASWLLPLALLGALLGHASHGRADEDDALDRADPAAVAAAGLRALQAGNGETLATLTDWPAVRTALAGDASSAPDVAEVRRTVLAWHRHAAASKDTPEAAAGAPLVEITGDTATARFPAPLDTTLALRRADGVWSLAGWSSLPKALFRPSEDPRVRQHLAFLRACTRLPAVSEDGALEFDGEVLLHDTRPSTPPSRPAAQPATSRTTRPTSTAAPASGSRARRATPRASSTSTATATRTSSTSDASHATDPARSTARGPRTRPTPAGPHATSSAPSISRRRAS